MDIGLLLSPPRPVPAAWAALPSILFPKWARQPLPRDLCSFSVLCLDSCVTGPVPLHPLALVTSSVPSTPPTQLLTLLHLACFSEHPLPASTPFCLIPITSIVYQLCSPGRLEAP